MAKKLAALLVLVLAAAILGAPADTGAALGTTAYSATLDGPTRPVIIQFQTPARVLSSGDVLVDEGQRLVRFAEERAQVLGRLDRKQTQEPRFDRDFTRLFNGMAARLSEQEIARVRSLLEVRAIFEDVRVRADLTDSVPKIGANQVWSALGATGVGVKVAVIDTGVDYTHPDLGSCLGPGCKVAGGYDFVNRDANPMDDQGHGTHVAGIVAADGSLKGVAPGASILAYKVLDSFGFGLSSDIIASLETAADPDNNPLTDDAADVANLSLGGPGDPDDPLSQAVDAAVATGIVLVVAAGNTGPGEETIGSPGTARSAITVGASDKADAIAEFSSRGPVIWPGGAIFKPDVLAPGVDICSARRPSVPGPGCIDANHVAFSGTSMAAPHVAGAAALLLDVHSAWTPAQVKMALRNTAVGLPYDPNIQGYGRIDVFRAAQLAGAPPIASISTSGMITDGVISGTASSASFQSYQLYIGEGMAPTGWRLLRGSALPVQGGTLYDAFDSSTFPDGFHTLRLDVSDSLGYVSQDRVLVKIDNIQLTQPLNNDVLRKGGLLEIRGSVLGGSAFQRYRVEYGSGTNPVSWSQVGVNMPGGGTTPVTNGVIAVWNTGVIGGATDFTLRVTIDNTWGANIDYARGLYLDATLKAGWPQRIQSDPIPCPFATRTTAQFLALLGNRHNEGTARAGALSAAVSGSPEFSALLSDCSIWAGLLEPVVADIDRNGRLEIVVYKGGDPPTVLVFRDDGSLLWSAAVGGNYISGGNLHIPLIVDLNADGFQEVIVHHPYTDDFSANYSELYAFAHDGSLVSGWPVRVPSDFRPTLLAADLDRDGNVEIVVKGNDAADRKMVVLDRRGRIAFQWGLPPDSFLILGGAESSPAVGNFDADAALEIVSAGPGPFAGYNWQTGEWDNSGEVHVYNVGGTEVPGWPRQTAGLIFSSPAIGDVNTDGLSEIMLGTDYIANFFPDYRYGGFYAFSPTGNVLPGWPFYRGYNFISSPSLGDLDGNGDLEIATSELGFGTFVLHHDGSIAAGWPRPTTSNDVYTTIIADVDGIGAADILTTAGGIYDHGGVHAWRFDGGQIAGFPKVTEVRADGPATVADVDADGQVEVIASSDFDIDLETLAFKRRGSLYVWDIPAAYRPHTLKWPHFHRDISHTGSYCASDSVYCPGSVCGANSFDAISVPERTDGVFAGRDDDRDGRVDESLPTGSGPYDCDRDGYTGSAEKSVTTSDQDPCGASGWPSDLVSTDASANRLDFQDLGSFVAPVRRLGTSAGHPRFSPRWDLVPGSVVGPAINVQDFGALLTGASGYPPMLGGQRAFGMTCPYAP